MFNKLGLDNGVAVKDNPDTGHREPEVETGTVQINTILKGSKLKGDIHVSCDLEIRGEVEGNITSEKSSNIVIMGTCKGNVTTNGGSVKIEGTLSNGNISAGKDVFISGKFTGGEIKAAGKIFVNGEFDGKLEGSEINIGEAAKCKGELLYHEFISIARGARVEAKIIQSRQELRVVKDSSGGNVVDMNSSQEASKDKQEVTE